MKLLIVDDEELTRTGLIKALNWEFLGIHEIYQADDGVNGLATALEVKPDIVLCDVRMPRMDGITMLERIEAQCPDIAAIFMSGYSDKEYFKAAIKLQAVSYIEKPIEPKEIQAAVSHAIEQRTQSLRRQNAENAHGSITASQLAFQLTVPYASCRTTVDELYTKFCEHYDADKFKYVTTFIVKFEHVPEQQEDLPSIYQTLRTFLAPMHLHVIYSEKRMFHIVYHIYGSIKPSGNTLSIVAEKLGSLFAPYGNYYTAIGDTVSGVSNTCHSYESAVILLQSSFFFEPDTILTSIDLKENCLVNFDDLTDAASRYIKAISEKNLSESNKALDLLKNTCTHKTNLMPNQIKSTYYELFSALYQVRREQKLLPDMAIENHVNIMDIMDTCFSFFTLHEMLCEKTASLFSDMEHLAPENATIYLIRNYISAHYKEPGLSVKDISDYAHLSTSYACTFFKAETGTTLNQYITEFRMEKAKLLLADPRYRISDISSAVGYNDGNYFGKSFRKYTGFSPSEYREKVLR